MIYCFPSSSSKVVGQNSSETRVDQSDKAAQNQPGTTNTSNNNNRAFDSHAFFPSAPSSPYSSSYAASSSSSSSPTYKNTAAAAAATSSSRSNHHYHAHMPSDQGSSPTSTLSRDSAINCDIESNEEYEIYLFLSIKYKLRLYYIISTF